jgi:TolA-binding protein
MTNKNVRSKVWLYAVILFTSAFIVLLLTAYSQIKLNKNLDYLNNQIYTKEHEKNQVQLSFANAQEINNKLTQENKKLQEENGSLTAELDQLKSYRNVMDSLNKSKLDTYDRLCQAQSEYLEGRVVESAQLLEGIDANLLNAYGNKLYGSLKDKIFGEAGKLLLDDGYQLYLKKNYADASKKLLQSWGYASDRDYSAKCLYYLAQAEAKSGNINAGIDHMKTLVNNFPSSGYIRSAKSFLKKYSDAKP